MNMPSQEKRTVMDICLTWNDYPNFIFSKVFFGPVNSFVFKFSDCYNVGFEKCYGSRFWDIYAVTAKSIKQAAGFIFEAKKEVVRFTERAISSAKEGNSYDYINSLIRTSPWSERGLNLIKYEEAAEVITDLCTTMGVDVTIESK